MTLFLLVLALAWSAPAAGAASSSTVSPEAEHKLFELANADRAANSLAPYEVAADLVDVARGHAERMAANGSVEHNAQVESEVQDWDAVGENVGRGRTADETHRAFMESDAHRGEILSTEYTQIGVGVHVDDAGVLWVAEVFRKPKPAAPAPRSPEPIFEVVNAPPPEDAPAPAAPPPPPPPAAAAPRPRLRAPRPARTHARETPPAPTPAAPAATGTGAPLSWPSELEALGAALAIEPLPSDATSVTNAVAPRTPARNERPAGLPLRVVATLLAMVVAGQAANAGLRASRRLR